MMTTAFNRQHAEQYRGLGCEAYLTKYALKTNMNNFC